VDPHRRAELRSLALHRAVGERLRREPALLDAARDRLRTWCREGKLDPLYCDAWLGVLDWPLERILEFLSADTERARELRQATPFAGVISASERWAIWRSVREVA
jgi:hypothetical protein